MGHPQPLHQSMHVAFFIKSIQLLQPAKKHSDIITSHGSLKVATKNAFASSR
jgi:hypothetical protein